MAIATAVGADLSLLADAGIDIYKQHAAEIGIYSIYYTMAGFTDLLGKLFLARTPEPTMVRNPSINLCSNGMSQLWNTYV